MNLNALVVIYVRWFALRLAQFRWLGLMTEAIRKVGKNDLRKVKGKR